MKFKHFITTLILIFFLGTAHAQYPSWAPGLPTYTTGYVVIGWNGTILPAPGSNVPSLGITTSPAENANTTSLSMYNYYNNSNPLSLTNNMMEVIGIPNTTGIHTPNFILDPVGRVGINVQPDATKGPSTGVAFQMTNHGASWLDNRTLVGPWTPNFQTGSTQFMLDVNGKGHFNDKVLIGDPNAVNINTTSYSYNLYVEKGIITEKIKVALKTDAANWSDYVFNKGYKLKTLSEVDAFVKKNGHLPDVPSASEVAKDGIDLAEMDATLLRKIEELTLYVIDLKKENEQLKKAVAGMKK